jgi:chaperonin cofactor prefoldin
MGTGKVRITFPLQTLYADFPREPLWRRWFPSRLVLSNAVNMSCVILVVQFKAVAMSKKPVEITREQLEALRTKFDLLQGDRKAYFETYEATKRSNEAQLKELRDSNKDLRRQLAELQRAGRDAAVGDVPGSATGSTAALGGASSSTTKLEGALKAKQMQYNTLRAKTAEKQKELNALQDHLRYGCRGPGFWSVGLCFWGFRAGIWVWSPRSRPRRIRRPLGRSGTLKRAWTKP